MLVPNTSANINFPVELEEIYSLYGPMLYGIAIEISPTEQEADLVFVDTFFKIHRQLCISPTHVFNVAQLMRLVIQTTGLYQVRAYHKPALKLKHPDQLPLMHLLLCEEQSLNHLCLDTGLTKKQVGKKLRQEFMRLRNMKTGNSLMWIA